MFISVDLPEPDGPMMATISPSATCSEMPFRTVRSAPPVLYVLTMSTSVITGRPSWRGMRRHGDVGPGGGHDLLLRAAGKREGLALMVWTSTAVAKGTSGSPVPAISTGRPSRPTKTGVPGRKSIRVG